MSFPKMYVDPKTNWHQRARNEAEAKELMGRGFVSVAPETPKAAPAPSQPPPTPSPQFEQMSRQELLQYAGEHDIKVGQFSSKATLIAQIQAHVAG